MAIVCTSGKQHARRNGLRQATQKQHCETRGNRRDKRAHGEQRDGDKREVFKTESAHEIRRQRHDDAQHEHIRRREPLPHSLDDAELGAYRREHGIQAGLG